MPDPATDWPRVRDDLRAEHEQVLQRLASPGTWFTGAQRTAIAAEARAASGCALCSERRDALAPTFVTGRHDRASELPEAIVDAVHRIAVDPGRLARSDFEAWTTEFTDAEYVEIIGVVVQITAVDTLAAALGKSPPALPEPVDGAPSQHRPPAAASDQAWVPTLPSGGRDPDSMTLFRGQPSPNVARALSLVPDEVRAITRLSRVQYVAAFDVADVSVGGGRAITRPQMELVAARVSALNECFY